MIRLFDVSGILGFSASTPPNLTTGTLKVLATPRCWMSAWNFVDVGDVTDGASPLCPMRLHTLESAATGWHGSLEHISR